MSHSTHRSALRTKAGSALIAIGLAYATFCVAFTRFHVQGMRLAGGEVEYYGTYWYYSAFCLSWALGFIVGATLVCAGVALRYSDLPGKLAAGVPLGVMGLAVIWLLVFKFPVLTPGFFGTGGVTSAISIMTIICLRTASLRAENPWPKLLQCVGLLHFATAMFVTCGIVAPPAAALFPELHSHPIIVSDFAHKIMIAWTVGWVLTALGTVLEWRAATQKSKVGLGDYVPTLGATNGPSIGAAAKSAQPVEG